LVLASKAGKARKKCDKLSLDKRPILWYIILMTIEEQKKLFPVGTKVAHKENPSIQGVVVGKSFGTPEKQNVRLQLTCGLTFDVTPFALKKVEQFL